MERLATEASSSPLSMTLCSDFVLEGDVGNDNHRPKSDTKTTPGGPVELDEPSANDTFPEVDESNASRIDVLINMLFMASIWTVAFMTLV